MNIIISGNSDSDVLVDSEADGGLRNYFLWGLLPALCPRAVANDKCIPHRSFGFSDECLGQHAGSDQAVNLGDGNGYRMPFWIASDFLGANHLDCRHWTVNETAVIRWNYGDAALGSCKETIEGGNHFRYWVQDGSSADRCVPNPWSLVDVFPIPSHRIVAQSLWQLHTRNL